MTLAKDLRHCSMMRGEGLSRLAKYVPTAQAEPAQPRDERDESVLVLSLG
jgi:hypothetical protein